MKRVFLIVETPRAGDFGHRFLVPSWIRDEHLVASIAEDAARNPEGKCHVAVIRSTEQRLKSGPVRISSESLILAGIDGERLTPAQLEKVRVGLGCLWDQVDSLLPRLKRFGLSSRAILLNCDEIDEWAQHLPLAELPNARLPTGRITAPGHRARGLPRIALCSIAIIALLLTCGFLWNQTSKPPSPGRSSSERLRVEVLRLLEKLAARWGCQTVDVASSICRATKRSTGADDPIARVLLEAASSESFLGRIRSLSAGRPESLVALLPESDTETAGTLRELLRDRGDGAALELRRSLYGTWRAFVTLSDRSRAVSQSLKRLAVEPSGFRRTIAFSAEKTLDPGLGTHFAEPVTPIFDEQDAMIIRLVKSWLDEGYGQGLDEAFRQAGVAVPEGQGLVDRLKLLHLSRKQIAEGLINEEKQVIYEVVKAKLDSNLVYHAYEAASGFFEGICGIAKD